MRGRNIRLLAIILLCICTAVPVLAQQRSQPQLTPSQIAIQITQVVNGWAQTIETLQQQNQQLHEENAKLKSENEELKKKLPPEK